MGFGSSSRGRMAAVAVVAGVALAASACGGSSGGSAAKSSASSPVTVASTTAVQKLDPAVMTQTLDFQALGLIYQPLLDENASLTLEPELATKWSVTDGGDLITFTLRPHVKFDDGSTMTSADVKATFERILKPATAAVAASYLAGVKSIGTPSPTTVTLTLSHPDSSLLYALASVNMAIVPAKAITAGTLASKPDGTGPYTFGSFAPNTSFTVKANPDYWGPKPSIPQIEFKTIANEQSIASGLQAGTVQVGLLSEPQVVQQLGGSGGVTVDKALSLSYYALMFQSKGPLANVNARLAVQCAINRRDILQAAVQGGGKIIGPVPQGPFTSSGSQICANQNLAQARKYLAKANMPNGFSFSILTSSQLESTATAQAVTIQSELAKVGIKVSIDNQASSDYIQNWLKGNFQGTIANNSASPSPYIMYSRYFGDDPSLAAAAGYQSASLASELQNADQSTSAATQKQLYGQFDTQIVNNAVWIWLYNPYNYYGVTSSVKGFSALPDQSLRTLATATNAR